MATKKKSKKAVAKKAVRQRHLKLDGSLSAIKAGQSVDQETGLNAAEGAGPEFLYVPVSSVAVLDQVRSSINSDSDSFKALMQSIKDRGILEPVLVTAQDGSGYTLLCGERRLLAAQQLGLETVPARIVDGASQEDEVIAYQLTENLQREDLNPIDQAQGILEYVQAKLPDKQYDVDGVLADLVKYNMKPDSLPQEVVETVSTVTQISGKTARTLFNGLSLLKLPDPIRPAVSEGTLPVSQGYLFAANLDCPDCSKIFESVLKTPVTNAALTNLLTAWKQPKPEPTDPKPIPVTKQVASIKTWETAIEKNVGSYKKADLQTLLDRLQAFVLFVKEKIKPAT
jgi:ParB family transcriptional regulator, chromosome partitioning protein